MSAQKILIGIASINLDGKNKNKKARGVVYIKYHLVRRKENRDTYNMRDAAIALMFEGNDWTCELFLFA